MGGGFVGKRIRGCGLSLGFWQEREKKIRGCRLISEYLFWTLGDGFTRERESDDGVRGCVVAVVVQWKMTNYNLQRMKSGR